MKLWELKRLLLPIGVGSLNSVIDGYLPDEDLLSLSIDQPQHLLCFVSTPHQFSVLQTGWQHVDGHHLKKQLDWWEDSRRFHAIYFMCSRTDYMLDRSYKAAHCPKPPNSLFLKNRKEEMHYYLKMVFISFSPCLSGPKKSIRSLGASWLCFAIYSCPHCWSHLETFTLASWMLPSALQFSDKKHMLAWDILHVWIIKVKQQ